MYFQHKTNDFLERRLIDQLQILNVIVLMTIV